MPYLNVTSQLEDTPDAGMLSKVGGNYFPYVVIMDAAGEVIQEFRPSDEKAAMKAVGDASFIVELKAKVAKNPEDKGAKASLELIQLINKRDTERPEKEIEALVATEGVDKRAVEAWKKFKPSRTVEIAFGAVRKEAMAKQMQQADFMSFAGTKMYEMYKAGTRLPVDDQMYQPLYFLAMQGAVDAKDIAGTKEIIVAVDKWIDEVVPAEQQEMARTQIFGEVKQKLADLETEKKKESAEK